MTLSKITIFLALISLLNSCKKEEKSSLIVAIYNDEGVWKQGVTKLNSYFSSKKIQHYVISSQEIDHNTNLKKANLLIFPGGNSAYYTNNLSEDGLKNIQNFVSNGGGYFGICAGAYFATDSIIWRDTLFNNLLDLSKGKAIGPLEGYENQTEFIDQPIAFSETDVFKSETTNISYLWGPYFSNLPSNVKIQAYYLTQNQPAIITTSYNKGKVLLSGVHLEVDEADWKYLDQITTWFEN